MLAKIELTHTPGLVYAVAYWLTTMLYTRLYGLKKDNLMQHIIEAVFFFVLSGFMIVTDGVSRILFVTSILFIGVIICTHIYLSLRCGLFTAIYVYMQAYILGEFMASLAWQIYFFEVTSMGVPNTGKAAAFSIGLVYVAIITGARFIGRRYGSISADVVLDLKKLLPALLIALITFIVSNLSFVSESPFSGTLPAEIFIIRTMTDFAGVGILFAYNMILYEVEARIEVEALQRMLEMQYNSYQIAEDSIALVNQKYHDLKHQIAVLRGGIDGEEKQQYLDRMEDEIRQFESLNKTGNDILDTILTSKGLLFQKAGIRLTTVADGSALAFMDNMDISALFGNALDNAMDGVMKLPDSCDRLIHLTVANQKGFLRIMVENRFDGDVEIQDGMPKTTKGSTAFHGFGVKSMKSIAEKYGGSLRISTEDGWFRVGILIPRP